MHKGVQQGPGKSEEWTFYGEQHRQAKRLACLPTLLECGIDISNLVCPKPNRYPQPPFSLHACPSQELRPTLPGADDTLELSLILPFIPLPPAAPHFESIINTMSPTSQIF